MEKLNITKGQWVAIGTEFDDYNISCNGFYLGEARKREDADLICEAGNVANETGLTPRELLNQRNELLEACKEIQKAIGVLPHNWHWTVKDAMPKVITAIANTTK